MRLFLLVAISFISSFSFGHEYFFAFAEVEYNEMDRKLEATLTLTTHDLERYLQERNVIQKDLKSALEDSLSLISIERELNQHFKLDFAKENSIMDGVELLKFDLEGFDTHLTGTIQLYLSMRINQELQNMVITFDLLMDEYPEQQNKLTFIYRDQKKTYLFLPSKRTQPIEF